MLWIALHLPLLSLESFAATLPPEAHGRPLALVDAQEILGANAPARALGVEPGIKRATALALAPHLLLGAADPARDAQALQAVAHAALAFTPMVTVQPPDGPVSAPSDDTPHTVLLEVQASLRCFGGLPALRRRLRDVLAPLGHRVHMVSAGTALGAAWLARVHADLGCADLPATGHALDRAPVALLRPGRVPREAFQAMGLHTLADLKRVPRDGLARRFGPELLDALDRARGLQPDPREALILPAAFDSRLELFERTDSARPLLHAAMVLLERLVAWLSAQHAFVRRFTLAMAHEQRSRHDLPTASTVLEVALAEPSRDGTHLLALLRERLVQLPAPTMELRLQAVDIARRASPNAELFPTPASEHEGLTRLIERLQARLGREQVQRLEPRPDHRPERATAWRTADARQSPRPGRAMAAAAGSAVLPPEGQAPARPVWLLQRPVPLPDSAHGPRLDGQPLQLLSGPERIESGWWDAERVERDYFIAQLPEGALVWIYRERVPVGCAGLGWFLQGRFG